MKGENTFPAVKATVMHNLHSNNKLYKTRSLESIHPCHIDTLMPTDISFQSSHIVVLN